MEDLDAWEKAAMDVSKLGSFEAPSMVHVPLASGRVALFRQDEVPRYTDTGEPITKEDFRAITLGLVEGKRH